MRFAVFLLGAVLLPAQTVVTIAGTGIAGFSGDGAAGTQAQVNNPYGLTIGRTGRFTSVRSATTVCDAWI